MSVLVKFNTKFTEISKSQLLWFVMQRSHLRRLTKDFIVNWRQ